MLHTIDLDDFTMTCVLDKRQSRCLGRCAIAEKVTNSLIAIRKCYLLFLKVSSKNKKKSENNLERVLTNSRGVLQRHIFTELIRRSREPPTRRRWKAFDGFPDRDNITTSEIGHITGSEIYRLWLYALSASVMKKSRVKA